MLKLAAWHLIDNNFFGLVDALELLKTQRLKNTKKHDFEETKRVSGARYQ